MARGLYWLCLGMILALGGCSAFPALSVRSQSPESAEPSAKDTRLVRDLAVPFGMFPVQVEAVGMVVGLQGTGSDASPSPQRAELIDDMQKRGVHNPNGVLASPSTSLVLVRGVLRPGIQKGDPFDLEIRVPAQSETTSLRGGHLLQARLRQLAVLDDNRLHEGSVLGLGEGPVMIDPAADTRGDRVMLCRGRVLGGGVAMKSRPLGLVLKPDHQNVSNSARVAAAVNRRFHLFEHGVKRGVATSKTDEYIELLVHPRYKENLGRYMAVVRATALRESEIERADRIARLRQQLLDPDTAADAAIRLEAIGVQGADALVAALGSNCTEVRFYAAEALAYLDRREAAPVLGEIARNEPAMRVYALNALGTMDNHVAYEELVDMLDLPSAETRYGAFRALCGMNAKDPLVAGERLAGGFSYHVLESSGPPMIHVTWNRRPELVLFGRQQQFVPPMALNAGNQIMITGNGSGEVAVSRFVAGEADQRRVVSPRVDEVVRAIVELGGTYPDVVQALQEAKAAGAYAGRFEVDSLPDAGRSFERVARDAGEDDDEPTVAPNKRLWGIIPIGRGTAAPEPRASENDSES